MFDSTDYHARTTDNSKIFWLIVSRLVQKQQAFGPRFFTLCGSAMGAGTGAGAAAVQRWMLRNPTSSNLFREVSSILLSEFQFVALLGPPPHFFLGLCAFRLCRPFSYYCSSFLPPSSPALGVLIQPGSLFP